MERKSNFKCILALSLILASNCWATSTIILSTSDGDSLGGYSFSSGDLIEYDSVADTGSLYLNQSLLGFDDYVEISALHLTSDNHIIFSTLGDAKIDDVQYYKSDLFDYDIVSQTTTLYLDGESAFGSNDNTNSVYIRNNGNILLSVEGGGTLGGLDFQKGDIVEYNANTDTATLFFDHTLFSVGSDIDGFHIVDNDSILLSTKDDAVLGGLSFSNGDIIQYNTLTDTASMYFSDTLFSNGTNVTALTSTPQVAPVPEPSMAALYGIGLYLMLMSKKRIFLSK